MELRGERGGFLWPTLGCSMLHPRFESMSVTEGGELRENQANVKSQRKKEVINDISMGGMGAQKRVIYTHTYITKCIIKKIIYLMLQ